jgi:hypothetical protein
MHLPIVPKSLVQPNHLGLQLNPFVLSHLHRVSLGISGVKGWHSDGVLGRYCLQLGIYQVKFGVKTLREDLERLLFWGEVSGQDARQLMLQISLVVNLRAASFVWSAYNRNISLL